MANVHSAAATENFVVYPIRAIRRKNIGEAMIGKKLAFVFEIK